MDGRRDRRPAGKSGAGGYCEKFKLTHYLMVGGSTDGSLDILRKYEGPLRWHSGPDGSQSDAINKGFPRSRRAIFAFSCADDAYLPGAVGKAVRHMPANAGYAGICGVGYLTGEGGSTLCRYPTKPLDVDLLKTECFIRNMASIEQRGSRSSQLRCWLPSFTRINSPRRQVGASAREADVLAITTPWREF